MCQTVSPKPKIATLSSLPVKALKRIKGFENQFVNLGPALPVA